MPEKIDYSKEVNVAVEWWANMIAILDTDSINLCADVEPGLAAELNLLSVESEQALLPAEIKDFKIELTNSINKFLETNDGIVLIVNYSPIGVLGQAVKNSGVNPNNLLINTSMWICEGEVKVKIGAYADEKVIYQAA